MRRVAVLTGLGLVLGLLVSFGVPRTAEFAADIPITLSPVVNRSDQASGEAPANLCQAFHAAPAQYARGWPFVSLKSADDESCKADGAPVYEQIYPSGIVANVVLGIISVATLSELYVVATITRRK